MRPTPRPLTHACVCAPPVARYLNHRVARDEDVVHEIAADFPLATLGTHWVKLDETQFPCATLGATADATSMRAPAPRGGMRLSRSSIRPTSTAKKKAAIVDNPRSKNEKFVAHAVRCIYVECDVAYLGRPAIIHAPNCV